MSHILSVRNYVRGVSAVETIIGISLLVTVILFSIQAITDFMTTGRNQAARAQALFLTEEALEGVRFIRDDDWTAFAPPALPVDTDLYLHIDAANYVLSTTATSTEGFTTVIRLYEVRRDNATNDVVQSGGSVDTETVFMTATTTWSGGTTALSQYLAHIHQ